MVDSKEEYAPLAAEDGSESESSYQEYRLRSLEPRTPFYRRSSTWAILITIVVAFAAGAVSGWSMKRESGAQVYRTDFAEARGAIDLEEVEFTGTALFDDDDGHAYVKPQEVSYVGKPSKEIDNAWHNLIDRRYTWITDEEAEAAWGPNYTQYWRKPGFGYRAGFDVLHTLHCVDVLRKVIYKDHYAKHPDVHHGHHPSKENDKGSHREKRKIAGFKQYHIGKKSQTLLDRRRKEELTYPQTTAWTLSAKAYNVRAT